MPLFGRITVAIITMLMCTCITSCMVGPNFHRPIAPPIKDYTETPLPNKTVKTPANKNAGKSQEFAWNEDVPINWWEIFHSKEINFLIQRGLQNSPNLMAAQSALRQAKETVNVQVGKSFFPAIDGQFSGERDKFAGATFGNEISSNLFNVYNAGVTVSYTLDTFGGARRQVESLLAQVDYQKFQLIAAYITLTTNIVTTAVTMATQQEQISATHYLLKDQEDQLAILQNQLRLGGIASATVLNQQTLVEQTRATLPPLEKALSQSRHTLSALIGAYPNEPLPVIHLESLNLAAKVPVSLPSMLVCQRPDIRAAEALFHSASAKVGVATANLFPQLTLSGTYGWTANIPAHLFHPISNAWTYMGQLTQPIFRGGALRAQRRAEIATYNQVGAQYAQTVLQAFQNVADTLRALETDARAFRAQSGAEAAARDALNLTKQQYYLGGVNFINLLTAQQQYQQTRINRIKAQGQRYADTAALFQALGGGWWNGSNRLCR